MKKLLLSIAGRLVSVLAIATIRTVSNFQSTVQIPCFSKFTTQIPFNLVKLDIPNQPDQGMRWLVHFHIFLGLFLSLSLNGQQVSPSVINTSGGNKNVGELFLDWSIGEMPITQTSSGTNIYVTNGFLQAGNGFIPTGILNLPPLTSNEIKISPNPSTGILNIRFELAKPGTIGMFLYDISGKKLMERQILHFGGSQSTVINLKSYPQGSYQLLLYYKTANDAQPKAGAFKLVKVN